MGDLTGHLIPGTTFIIIALWWSTKSILKHICKQQKRSSSLLTKDFFSRAEVLEGIVLISVTLIGITGLYTFLENHGQFSDKEFWFLRIVRWHHAVIYIVFALLGVTRILCFIISSLPLSLVNLMLSNAFFVEAFIFYYHTYGRSSVDSFVHQLLSFNAFLVGLVAFIEFLSTKTNVLLELLTSSLTLLHGMWFWQAGFVLFPQNRDHVWDLYDNSNIPLLAMCFCSYYVLAQIIIGINYLLITR
ncbi:transmembrane protein 45A-like [Acomys russatus]|uniref:transmembrane protein 45A-like n=1 Tax=Acomys russatus TaxID=60746 RepID=UPI0021E338A4|nr:transmembrane protein 45A-like [Acomys russatus]